MAEASASLAMLCFEVSVAFSGQPQSPPIASIAFSLESPVVFKIFSIRSSRKCSAKFCSEEADFLSFPEVASIMLERFSKKLPICFSDIVSKVVVSSSLKIGANFFKSDILLPFLLLQQFQDDKEHEGARFVALRPHSFSGTTLPGEAGW